MNQDPNLKPGQIALIEWVDSATEVGWLKLSNYEAGIGHIKSVGWVISNTPELISLTTSLTDQNHAIDPIAIPWNSITRLVLLSMPV